jgi:two-component system, NarL family, sensor kinase
MKQLFAGTLCFVIICVSSCANNDAYPSISSISTSWLKIKSDIINSEQDGDIENSIEDFRLILKKYLSSPFIYLYKIHRPENIQILADIESAADSLKNALKEGGGLSQGKSDISVFPIILEIDSNLEKLQLIEKSLSEASQLQYFQLLFFLCVLIISIVLALWALYSRFEKAVIKERQSLAFSHLTIEGLEAERRRVSRELHDTVLPLVKDAQVSALIRSICVELMPPDFARLSLNDSLAGLCVQFTKRSGIECACSIEDGLSFSAYSPERQLHIYRMVQESFTNIEKHSKAGRAALVVRHSDENILICVSDDGDGLQSKTSLRGIPLSADGIPSGAELGIKSMRQRADILGAKLNFISESGNGLMVRIELSPVATGGVL